MTHILAHTLDDGHVDTHTLIHRSLVKVIVGMASGVVYLVYARLEWVSNWRHFDHFHSYIFRSHDKADRYDLLVWVRVCVCVVWVACKCCVRECVSACDDNDNDDDDDGLC